MVLDVKMTSIKTLKISDMMVLKEEEDSWERGDYGILYRVLYAQYVHHEKLKDGSKDLSYSI